MKKVHDHSFTHNQSCPNVMAPPFDRVYKSPLQRHKFDSFTGNEFHSISFNHGLQMNSTDKRLCYDNNQSTASINSSKQDASNLTITSVTSQRGGGGNAMVTFNVETNQILTATKRACQLFGVDDLSDKNFSQYFKQEIIWEDDVMSGKILELVRNDGEIIPVSVWLKKHTDIDSQRCIAVIEKVIRIGTSFVINRQSDVVNFDDGFASVFGRSPEYEEKIQNFIPKLKITSSSLEDTNVPKQFEQCLCGVSFDEGNFKLTNKFPLCITMHENPENKDQYLCDVIVYSSISGVISVDEDGMVENLNETFSHLLLGYSKKELQNESIFDLIPRLTPHHLRNLISKSSEQHELSFEDNGELVISESIDELNVSKDLITEVDPPPSPHSRSATNPTTPHSKPSSYATSTPSIPRQMVHGSSLAVTSLEIRHKDLSLLPIHLECRKLESKRLVWIQHTFCPPRKQCLNNESVGSLNTSHHSSTSALRCQNNKNNNTSIQEEEDDFEISGRLAEFYEFDTILGRGGFGVVYSARHTVTREKVAIKFIKREKLTKENMEKGIPLEIVLLTKFNHPNIVKSLEYFENTKYFSYVMSLHGDDGIDLFDFIDRHQYINETLGCYIFTQICSAVRFLHRKGILHRDLKDENVIIDEKFNCKLIDFGSACYFKKGQRFTTFHGTLEYCAPEILRGDSYCGEQVEIFALGVTLYTLICGENPFASADETLAGKLNPPCPISGDLRSLLEFVLELEPDRRATMNDIFLHSWSNMFIDIKKLTTSRDESESSLFSDENLSRDLTKDSDVIKLSFINDVTTTSNNDNNTTDDDVIASPLSRQLENLNI